MEEVGMYTQKWIRILYCSICIFGILLAHAQNITQAPSSDRITQENLCCIGTWHEKPAWTVTHDQTRNIMFLGSCGCVCMIDVSSPANLQKIKEFKHSQCNTSGLFYQPETHRLYICDGISGLVIWDITDVREPEYLGNYDTPGYACAVYVQDNYAYVADGDRGLRIIDVSTPETPREASSLEMTTACGVYVQGQYAYIADIGLRIIDVSNPYNPQDMAYHETPGVACDVYVRHNLAYVADEWCGLRIIDVSDPMDLHEVSHAQTPGHAWGVYVTGSLAYIAAYGAGLRVVDVRNPIEPLEVAFHETANHALDATVMGSRIYIAAAGQGMLVYHLE